MYMYVCLSVSLCYMCTIFSFGLHCSFASVCCYSLLHFSVPSVSQQNPMFGASVRLCKRWVSAHLLSNHITDMAVELMVAHLFTQPEPFSLPK